MKQLNLKLASWARKYPAVYCEMVGLLVVSSGSSIIALFAMWLCYYVFQNAMAAGAILIVLTLGLIIMYLGTYLQSLRPALRIDKQHILQMMGLHETASFRNR